MPDFEDIRGRARDTFDEVTGRTQATVNQSLSEIAWTSRWRAVISNATYSHTFGLETAYRQANGAWGFPLEQDEIAVMYNGQQVQGRNFTEAGLVVWVPSQGAVTIGRPQ